MIFEIYHDLCELLGTECVSADPDELRAYSVDWTRIDCAGGSALVFVRSVEQVKRLVEWSNARRVPLVPSGGRTGLSGGAVASGGEVVVSFQRMNRVLCFDAVSRAISVEAGFTTQGVQEIATSRGLMYPVDFASRGSSQIGGNIATNAGGVRVLRYGLTRNWVTGLKVVTGTGEILDLNNGLIKNATGYDLRQLFIGSEGTLGLIVEATLRLTDPPPPQQVMMLGLPSAKSVMDVFFRSRRRLALSAFEFFTEQGLRHVEAAGGRRPFDATPPYYVLAEFDENQAQALEVYEECYAAGLVLDGVLSQSQSQADDLWRLREGITESVSHCRPYKNDISVRIDQIPVFMARIGDLFAREYPNFEVIWFGHIGDGNLHISILPPDDWSRDAFEAECARVTHKLGTLLQKFGGSISAEHGIGLLKRPYLHYTRSPAEVDLMRQMKRVFDPAGILNPGKLLPP